jgi:hypothetical protein
MKLLGYLVTVYICLSLCGCAPTTLASLKKSLAQEMRPITKSPKETLIGTWRTPNGFFINHENGLTSSISNDLSYWAPSKDNNIPKGKILRHKPQTGQFQLIKSVPLWAYNGDKNEGVITFFEKYRRENSSIGERTENYSIIFVNDNKIIRRQIGSGDGIVRLWERAPMKKAPTPPKRSRSSGGMSKNAKLYYDWLVKRELGDPGPIPKVSNFDRKEALLYWKLLIGGQPTPEIRYGR